MIPSPQLVPTGASLVTVALTLLQLVTKAVVRVSIGTTWFLLSFTVNL